jgi:hypothetical protein
MKWWVVYYDWNINTRGDRGTLGSIYGRHIFIVDRRSRRNFYIETRTANGIRRNS